MSKQVFKYPVREGYDGLPAEVSIPKDAKLVYYGVDGNGEFCFWAEVQTGAIPDDVWYMRSFGTGHPIPDAGKFQGTLITHNGFVFHLYRFDSSVEGADS